MIIENGNEIIDSEVWDSYAEEMKEKQQARLRYKGSSFKYDMNKENKEGKVMETVVAPVTFDEFKNMSLSEQAKYLKLLNRMYGVKLHHVADMMKVTKYTLDKYVDDTGLVVGFMNGDGAIDGNAEEWEVFKRRPVFPKKKLTFDEFKALGHIAKKLYLEWLMREYMVGKARVAKDMFGLDEHILRNYLKNNSIDINIDRRDINVWSKRPHPEWDEFIGKKEEPKPAVDSNEFVFYDEEYEDTKSEKPPFTDYNIVRVGDKAKSEEHPVSDDEPVLFKPSPYINLENIEITGTAQDIVKILQTLSCMFGAKEYRLTTKERKA